MNLYRHYGHRLIGVATLIAMLLIGGCSGITPGGDLRNNREEGPESGIFSGPGGEFVIVAPASDVADKKAEAEEAVKSSH